MITKKELIDRGIGEILGDEFAKRFIDISHIRNDKKREREVRKFLKDLVKRAIELLKVSYMEVKEAINILEKIVNEYSHFDQFDNELYEKGNNAIKTLKEKL